MRVTNSVDGVKRVNLQITHRMAGYDFANALCLVHREHDLEDDGPLPDLSRSKVLEAVRKVLAEKPDDRHWWRDHIEDDFADELWAWADALVRGKFPEMY